MADTSFVDRVVEAFGVLGVERPAARGRVFAALGAISVGIQSEGQGVRLAEDEVEGCALSQATEADVVVQVGRATLLGLGEGRVDFLDAVLGEAIGVRGHASDLVRVHGALVAFLEGAARAPGMSGVWERYRGGAA